MREQLSASDIEERLRKLEDRLEQRKPSRWKTRFASSLLLAALVVAVVIGVRWGVEAQGGGSSPAPGVLNYQGQLTDAAGNPLDANHDVTFSLYNVSEGGTALWTEAHTGANAVSVTAGLFSTLLGSITPIPSDVMSSSPLYLGVAVSTDAEMMPRQPVSSVAYALLANDVADGAITESKIADGAVTTAKLGTGTVTTEKIALNAVSKVVFTDLWYTGPAGFSAPGDNAFHRIGLMGSFATAGGDLFIMGGPSAVSAAGCTNFVSVALDGEPVDGNNPPTMCMHSVNSFIACSGFRYVPSFPAGDHTIQAVLKNNCATISLYPHSSFPIAVLELKR